MNTYTITGFGWRKTLAAQDETSAVTLTFPDWAHLLRVRDGVIKVGRRKLGTITVNP
jgi:hypothetical protein